MENEIIVKIKKLCKDAVIPKYAHPTDAGMDLVAVSSEVDKDDKYIEYRTGIAIKLPKGYMGLIFPRSSISKYDLTQANCVGVIDENYTGEIKVRFKRANMVYENELTCKLYEAGDKIAQLIIMPVPKVGWNEVEELETTDRGNGGFGSTGI